MLSTIIAAAAGLAVSLQATSGTPQVIIDAVTGTPDPALWRTGDADTTVYLFGTVHVMPKEAKWETPLIRDAFEEADLLITEADVDSEEAMTDSLAVVMKHGFFLDGRKLVDLYTEEEAEKINEDLAPYNLTLKELGNQKPWLATLNLVVLQADALGLNSDYGIDWVVEGWAREKEIPLQYFETAKQQALILATIPLEEQKLFFTVELDVDDDRTDAELFGEMIGQWFRGDSEGAWHEMEEDMAELPLTRAAMLDTRNENWALQLDKLIREFEGTIFVAVGSGHLEGGQSVQHYLAEHGHETVRLNPYKD